MLCPKCAAENPLDATRCSKCSDSLSVAVLEVIRGELPEKIRFLKPRPYDVGRARHNDIAFNEPSISKLHARIDYQGGRFFIEDAGSMHGVYVNATKISRVELTPGAQIQLGNITLAYGLVRQDASTGRAAPPPWIEQQQLVLSLIHALSATLVQSEVLDRVLEGVMRITRAERGFMLLAPLEREEPPPAAGASVAGLRVVLTRRRDGREEPLDAGVISTSVVRRTLERGETIATGNALTDPSLANAQSIAVLELRTIVYDLWDEQYVIHFEGPNGKRTRRVKYRAEALKLVTAIEDFPIAMLADIPHEDVFYLTLTVQLNPVSKETLAEGPGP